MSKVLMYAHYLTRDQTLLIGKIQLNNWIRCARINRFFVFSFVCYNLDSFKTILDMNIDKRYIYWAQLKVDYSFWKGNSKKIMLLNFDKEMYQRLDTGFNATKLWSVCKWQKNSRCLMSIIVPEGKTTSLFFHSLLMF